MGDPLYHCLSYICYTHTDYTHTHTHRLHRSTCSLLCGSNSTVVAALHIGRQRAQKCLHSFVSGTAWWSTVWVSMVHRPSVELRRPLLHPRATANVASVVCDGQGEKITTRTGWSDLACSPTHSQQFNSLFSCSMNGLFIVCILLYFLIQNVSEPTTKWCSTQQMPPHSRSRDDLLWGTFLKLQNVDTHSSFGSRGANILCTNCPAQFFAIFGYEIGTTYDSLTTRLSSNVTKGVWPFQGRGGNGVVNSF